MKSHSSKWCGHLYIRLWSTIDKIDNIILDKWTNRNNAYTLYMCLKNPCTANNNATSTHPYPLKRFFLVMRANITFSSLYQKVPFIPKQSIYPCHHIDIIIHHPLTSPPRYNPCLTPTPNTFPQYHDTTSQNLWNTPLFAIKI